MLHTRSSGILLHPTSLWGDFGIGDLGSAAEKFVDFLRDSGMKLWQTLPLCPCGPGNSPYNGTSAFAGNPYLISPEILAERGLVRLAEVCRFPKGRVEYDLVYLYKDSVFREAFQRFLRIPHKEGFTAFCEENRYWLEDFALYSAVKEYFARGRRAAGEDSQFREFQKFSDGRLSEREKHDYYFRGAWCSWPKDIANREPGALSRWKELLSQEVLYHKFLQYEFFSQWQGIKEYANSRGVKIIGDMPIFVAYDSADTWAHRELFILDERGFPAAVAGVPPDYFSETGQRWGNPLYAWEKHRETGYRWWILRAERMSRSADYVRLDHFRGFESYWEIPAASGDARNGRWAPGPGAEFFGALKSALGSLPFIAEDLGIITENVTELMKYAGLPGMKILQFAFLDGGANPYLPHNYTEMSVVYTGTHDNDTACGWYSNASEKEKDLYRRYMNVDGSSPAWDLIRLAMSSVAEFAIFPMQDVLSLGSRARMNIPGKPDGNWEWRISDTSDLEWFAQGLKYHAELFNR